MRCILQENTPETKEKRSDMFDDTLGMTKENLDDDDAF